MRASKEHDTYGVRLFAESQDGGPCNGPLCVQHHPFLGDSLWSWRLGRAPHWHLHQRVDQVVQFDRKAFQTFLYFPEERTNRRGLIYAFFFFFNLLDPSFYGYKPKKSQFLKPTSHTHKHSSHCYLHCSTPSPWALLLKRVFLLQPASRLSLEQLLPMSWIPAFLQTWGTSRALPCVFWGVPGLNSTCSFCRAGEKALVVIIFIFGYTNLTWAYTCLSKALGFNLWFSWAWCAAKSST